MKNNSKKPLSNWIINAMIFLSLVGVFWFIHQPIKPHNFNSIPLQTDSIYDEESGIMMHRIEWNVNDSLK